MSTMESWSSASVRRLRHWSNPVDPRVETSARWRGQHLRKRGAVVFRRIHVTSMPRHITDCGWTRSRRATTKQAWGLLVITVWWSKAVNKARQWTKQGSEQSKAVNKARQWTKQAWGLLVITVWRRMKPPACASKMPYIFPWRNVRFWRRWLLDRQWSLGSWSFVDLALDLGLGASLQRSWLC